MERKIGEIFEYNGEWYQCIPDTTDDNCNNCFFQKRCSDIVGDCSSTVRSDGKSVAFKKLEKVGGPCEFQKRTIQTYKLYTEPFISVDMMDFIWAYLDGSSTIDIIIKQGIEDMGDYDIRPYDELFSPGTVSNTKYLAKEDMEEMKLNLKPFDIQKAREGKPVCTRDGRKARIVCFDRVDAKPILALIASTDGKCEDVFDYFISGKRIANAFENDLDLMMLPEKKEGWVNVRRLKSPGDNDFPYVSTLYPTKEEATTNANLDVIDTIKIDWEE